MHVKRLQVCHLGWLVSVLWTFVPAATVCAQADRQVVAEGRWWGLAELGAPPQRISIELRRLPDGTWTGYFDVLRTVNRRLPLRGIRAEGDTLAFSFTIAGGRDFHFHGVIDDGVLEGDLESPDQRGRLRAELEPPRKPRVQEPVGSPPYEVREVVVESGGVRLPATLTLPRATSAASDDGVPGVVLLAAPNSLGRDQDAAGHKPFLVLADRLTRAGYAVLRYDDRTLYTAGVGDVSEVVDDASAALRLLAATLGVRPEAVGVIAHGEGALLAMNLLTRDEPTPAFAVLLNPPGLRGIDLKPRQIARELTSVGTPVTFSRQYLEREMAALSAVVEGDRAKLRAALLRLVALRSGEQREEFPDGEARFGFLTDLEMPRYDNAWNRYYLSTDPAELLAAARKPVLLLHGLLDQTHIAEDNVPPLEAALKRSASAFYAVELVPSVNHRLQTAHTGARAEVSTLEETVSEPLMRRIADWISMALRR